MNLRKITFHCFIILFFTCSCNTLYNSKTIDIEIVQPSKVNISNEFKNVAIQYNNVNVSPNNYFNTYLQFGEQKAETENTDSIASHIYFNTFIEELKQHRFFDTVIILSERNYSTIAITDTLGIANQLKTDSAAVNKLSNNQINVLNGSYFIKNYTAPVLPKTDTLFIHPEFGLYTSNQLAAIGDSSKADLLISLDFFASSDYSTYQEQIGLSEEQVINWYQWSFYSLKPYEYLLVTSKTDSVAWMGHAFSKAKAGTVIPPRKDAVFNAAELSAEKFSSSLVPHWIKVQRMYYASGHIELKQTDALVKAGQWLEAAEIWKRNTNNKNKLIAAKSMFNMGLACEMEGELKAALDWVIKSYYLLESKNEIHTENCKNYIRILGLRMNDIKRLDEQFGHSKN
ncbi:DUF6340 family protein [uncultured Draconibacterium sp.]|uniref:DUF6340 family protein n=1 Tax=uncultured Draconibacterium sp. TaxID=1573823 RepID=UPI0025CFE224|nr:DUF6340 family protein [uncultured Draconibacterium sp.]